jgi:hypothetical protein
VVIELAVQALKFTANALFLESAAPGNPDTGVILNRSRDFQAVQLQSFEAKPTYGLQGVCREAAARVRLPEPVADSGRAVLQMDPAYKDAARQLKAI